MPRLVLLLAPPLAALGLACAEGCSSADATATEGKPALLTETDIARAVVGPVGSGPRISGTLQPAQRAILRAEASGTVTEVRAELGDPVAANALLARIENRGVQGSWAGARSGLAASDHDLTLARRDLERSRKLATAGAVSARDLELAELSVAAAEARAAQARAGLDVAGEHLDGVNVKAPIAGVIAQRSVSIGDIVAPGSPLFTVIDPSSLRLEASVPADELALVKPGVAVQFTVQGNHGRTFDGEVVRVAPAVDPVTRQLPILVSIPNEDGSLIAGLFAEGRVAAAMHDALLVPLDAVGDGGTVLRVRGGRVETVVVTLGVVAPERELVEVLTGLEVGDPVLLGAARDTVPGSAVEIRNNG